MQACLQDAGAQYIVAGGGSSSTASPPVRPGAVAAGGRLGAAAPACGLLPEHPAYVIYTRFHWQAQGVPIPPASATSCAANEVLGVRHGDKVYQGFSVAFDMSFEEIWISYLVGASLWVAPRC